MLRSNIYLLIYFPVIKFYNFSLLLAVICTFQIQNYLYASYFNTNIISYFKKNAYEIFQPRLMYISVNSSRSYYMFIEEKRFCTYTNTK